MDSFFFFMSVDKKFAGGDDRDRSGVSCTRLVSCMTNSSTFVLK